MSRLADQSNDKTKSNQELEKVLEANPSQTWVCISCGFSLLLVINVVIVII